MMILIEGIRQFTTSKTRKMPPRNAVAFETGATELPLQALLVTRRYCAEESAHPGLPTINCSHRTHAVALRLSIADDGVHTSPDH